MVVITDALTLRMISNKQHRYISTTVDDALVEFLPRDCLTLDSLSRNWKQHETERQLRLAKISSNPPRSRSMTP